MYSLIVTSKHVAVDSKLGIKYYRKCDLLYRWCTVVNTFMFYKAFDTIVINICRISLCTSQFIGRKLPKLLFFLHCLSWLVQLSTYHSCNKNILLLHFF